MVNRASGRRLDPSPLVAAMSGAEVTLVGLDELERVDGADRIAVAGGDGTIAPVAALASELGVPLGVIPGGTANDFARVNGLPFDPVEAARLAATGSELRPLELGRLADGRPFVNSAAAGLASVAGRRAQPLKSRYGPLAYGIGGRPRGRVGPSAARLCSRGRRRGVRRRRVADHRGLHGRVRRRLGNRRGRLERRGPGRGDHPGGVADGVGAAGVGAANEDDRAPAGGAALRGAGRRGGVARRRGAQL